VGFFTKPQLVAVGNLSRWAFLLTFAGVGLRTNLRELSKQGARAVYCRSGGRDCDRGDYAGPGVWG